MASGQGLKPSDESLTAGIGATPTKKRRTPADPNKPKTKRTKSSTTVSTLVQNIDAANQAQMAEAAKNEPHTAAQPTEDKTVTTSTHYQPSSEPSATEAPKTTTTTTPRPQQQQQQFESNHSPSLFINQKLFDSSAENSPTAAKVEVKLDFSKAPSDTESDHDLISSYSTNTAKYNSTEPGKLEYHLSGGGGGDSGTVSVRLPGAQTSALSISSSLPSSSSSASSSSSELEMDDLIAKTAHPSKQLPTA